MAADGRAAARGYASVADTPPGNWVDRYAPEWLKPYGRLARWDRPIGFWLLFWPCAMALALVALAEPERGFKWWYLVLMLVGAVLMRGAGCTFNDIVDTGIDMQVARTRSRPIPSGAVTRTQAAIFLVGQAILGLVVLLQFNRATVLLGLASLVLVAIYPFMKRITWWPQIFLGLAFSWGALLGWTAVAGRLELPPLILYVSCILWTVGYDTIYALQDVEDDALVGVKSTARLFGSQSRIAVGLFYALALVGWLAAGVAAGGGWPTLILLAAAGGVLAWQVVTLEPVTPEGALVRFKANNLVGLLVAVAYLADYAF